jgi:hypothetical protein
MTDGTTSITGSLSQREVASARHRARQFAVKMMYGAQFQAVLPMLKELESYEESDETARLLEAVLAEALRTFPLMDDEI